MLTACESKGTKKRNVLRFKRIWLFFFLFGAVSGTLGYKQINIEDEKNNLC